MSRLKASLAVSLFLHVALLYNFLHNSPPKITLPTKHDEQPTHGSTLEIVPPDDLTMPSAKPVEVKKKGYYGIGVYQDPFPSTVVCDGKFYNGWRVDIVVEGYPASLAGIAFGDIIIEVDGHIVKDIDEVRGFDESLVTITVCRSGIRRIVTMKRQFIRER